MQKINVVVFQVNCLGDFIATLPLLKALATLPEINTLTLVTSPVGEKLVKPLSLVDQVIAYDQLDYRSFARNPIKMLKAACGLRNPRFDACLLMDDECSTSSILARLSGAPFRVGYDRVRAKASWLNNRIVHFDHTRHVVHNRFDALKALVDFFSLSAESIKSDRVPLPTTESASEFVEKCRIDSGIKKFIVIHPFAKYEYKEWPLERYRAVALKLLDQNPELGVFVVADSKPDRWGIENRRFEWITGTTLDELIALLDEAVLFIGNNSGPMNITINQGTPTICINGPSGRWWFDPWDDGKTIMLMPESDCIECDSRGDARGVCINPEYIKCLLSIGECDVLAASALLIGDNRKDSIS